MQEERLNKALVSLECFMTDTDPESMPEFSQKVYSFVKSTLPFLIAGTSDISTHPKFPIMGTEISPEIELGSGCDGETAIFQYGLNVHAVITDKKIYLYEFINNFEPSKFLTDSVTPEQFSQIFLKACQNPLNNICFKRVFPLCPLSGPVDDMLIWYKDYPNKTEVEDHLKQQLIRLEMFKTLQQKQPSEKLYAFVEEALRYTVVNPQIKISLDEAEGWADFLQAKSSEIPSTLIFSYGLKVSVEVEEVNEKIECVFYEAKDRSNYEVKNDLTAEEFGKLLLKKCMDPTNN